MKKMLIFILFLLTLTSCELDLNKIINQIEEISSSFIKADSDIPDSFNLDSYDSITSIMPNSGTINPLILPIMMEDGNDSPKYMTSNISDLFFSNELTWESLSSYYKKSSYNKLNIKGYVKSYINLDHDNSYYISYENSDYKKANDIILEEVINKLNVNLKEYDTNDDKIIDSLYLIYNTTDNQIFKTDFIKSNFKIGDYYIKQYVTLNIVDMFKDDILCPDKLIYQTAKMLNMPNYIDDSNKGSNKGVGTSDIMTGNLIDHNPFSKLLMNWVTPTVCVRGEQYFTLKPFEISGNMLILNASFDEEKNIMDEYFIIDFFSNSMINRITDLTKNGGGYAENTLVNGSMIYREDKGIRIYHVNALRKNDEFINNNSNTSNSILSLLNGNTLLSSREIITNKVLYKSQDIIKIQSFNESEFINVYNKKWEILVNSISNDECVLKITLHE